jgi:hypothetical protein
MSSSQPSLSSSLRLVIQLEAPTFVLSLPSPSPYLDRAAGKAIFLSFLGKQPVTNGRFFWSLTARLANKTSYNNRLPTGSELLTMLLCLATAGWFAAIFPHRAPLAAGCKSNSTVPLDVLQVLT